MNEVCSEAMIYQENSNLYLEHYVRRQGNIYGLQPGLFQRKINILAYNLGN